MNRSLTLKAYQIDHKLASAVASGSSFSIPYPDGYSPTSFAAFPRIEYAGGGALSSASAFVNYGSSRIKVTNSTGSTWESGSIVRLIFDMAEPPAFQPENGYGADLLLIGDSINARLGDVPTSISAHYANINTIRNTANGVYISTVSAHGLSGGQSVYVSEGSASPFPTRSGITNRRFKIGVVSATDIVLAGAPADTKEYSYASGAFPYITLDAAHSIQSSWAWTMFLLHHPFDRVYNRCVPGAETVHVIEKLPELLAIKPRYVGLCCGVNDVSQGTSEDVTIKNITAIVDAFAEIGAVVIIDTVTPQSTMSDTKNIALKRINAAIYDLQKSRKNVIVVDIYSVAVDPTSSSGIIRSDISTDGTHPNGHGCYVYGKERADVLRYLFPTRSFPAFYAGVNETNYFTNGKMAGTGGTVTTSTDGVAATGWTIGGSLNTANVTAVYRKQKGAAYGWIPSTAYALGDVVLPTTGNGLMYVCTAAGTSGSSAPTWGTVAYATTTDSGVTWTAHPKWHGKTGEEWQYFTLTSGASVGSNEYSRLEQTITLATAGLAVGDVIRGRCRVKFFDGRHRGFSLRLRGNTQIGGQFPSAFGMAKSTFLDQAKATYADGMEGTIVTPPWRIPEGTTQLVCQFETTMTAVNMTCRGMVTDFVIEKVAEYDPA